jgi:hypothetical protein
MEQIIENKEMISTRLVLISCAAALLVAFFYTLMIISGSWTLRVESNQVTISIKISVFDDSFLEVRLKDGSHHTKEKMDAQKDRLDIRRDDLRLPFNLWAVDGWW